LRGYWRGPSELSTDSDTTFPLNSSVCRVGYNPSLKPHVPDAARLVSGRADLERNRLGIAALSSVTYSKRRLAGDRDEVQRVGECGLLSSAVFSRQSEFGFSDHGGFLVRRGLVGSSFREDITTALPDPTHLSWPHLCAFAMFRYAVLIEKTLSVQPPMW
jgi:hypothetical protein